MTAAHDRRARLASLRGLVASVLVLAGAAGSSVQSLASSPSLDDALEVRQQVSRRTIDTQRAIESLDDATAAALLEYRAVTEEARTLEVYNDQLERLVASQAEDRAMLERQRGEIEVTKRLVFPFLDRMLTALEEFVALDKPFLAEERALRLRSLRAQRDRANVSLADKFRRLLESYQIEANYGRTISTYQETIDLDGEPTTVDVLRFGRVGLYYLTLDGERTGMWNSVAKAWHPLGDGYRHTVAEGLAIARRQKPPALIRLPVVFGAALE